MADQPRELKEEIEKVIAEIKVYAEKVYTKDEILRELDELVKETESIANKMEEVEDKMTKLNEALGLKFFVEKNSLMKHCEQLLKKFESLKQEIQYANATKEDAEKTKKDAEAAQERIETAIENAETTEKGETTKNPGNAPGEDRKLQQQLEEEKVEVKKVKLKAKEVEQEAYKKEWEEYYMKIACLAASRSKDPSTPVGACIVDTKTHQIVGIGYNSMPYVEGGHNDKIFPWKGLPENASREEKDNKDKNPELKYPFVVHAAVNAITNRTRDKLDGCTIYITLKPDEDCARAIQLAGIKEIVYCMYTRKEERQRETDMERSDKFLKANKVETREMIISNENEAAKKLDDRILEAKKQHERPEEKRPKEAYSKAITWEGFFMGIATLAKMRPGYDRKSDEVTGACIVSSSKQVMSVGYSGYPEDMELGEIEQEDTHKEYITHAEYKAIIGGPTVRGCTLYVTSYPCNVCARLIVQSGISEIVYREDKGYKNSRTILKHCLESKNKIHVRECNSEDKKLIDSLHK